MKLLLDFLPLILFFGTFKYAEGHEDWAAAFATEHLGFLVAGGHVGRAEAPVLLATVVVMAATIAQVIFLKLRRRKVDLMLWISLALVVVMGGATIYFHSETFIKWKPTGLYWGMAVVFLVSDLVFRKNLLRSMMEKDVQLPDLAWRRMNLGSVLFFVALGFLNLYVAFHFPTATWANFKVFGVTGLFVLFTLGQGLYMSRHIIEPAAQADGADEPAKEGHAP